MTEAKAATKAKATSASAPEGPVGNPDHVLGEAHAPYPSARDVANRVNAAGGSAEHYARQDPPEAT
jgi:hypothetical protein